MAWFEPQRCYVNNQQEGVALNRWNDSVVFPKPWKVGIGKGNELSIEHLGDLIPRSLVAH